MATNDTDLTQALSQLESSKQPLTKRLKPFIPAIEGQVENGVPMEEIVALLKDRGFDLTVEYLRTILYRHRKAMKKKGVQKTRESFNDQSAIPDQATPPDGNPADSTDNVKPAIDNVEKDGEDGSDNKPGTLDDVFARQRKNEYLAETNAKPKLIRSRK